MNRDLRIEILKKFDTQADFAPRVKMSQSKVSQVIRGRLTLSQNEAQLWEAALRCDPDLLRPITKVKE